MRMRSVAIVVLSFIVVFVAAFAWLSRPHPIGPDNQPWIFLMALRNDMGAYGVYALNDERVRIPTQTLIARYKLDGMVSSESANTMLIALDDLVASLEKSNRGRSEADGTFQAHGVSPAPSAVEQTFVLRWTVNENTYIFVYRIDEDGVEPLEYGDIVRGDFGRAFLIAMASSIGVLLAPFSIRTFVMFMRRQGTKPIERTDRRST